MATQAKGLTVANVMNPTLPVQVFQEGGTLNKSVGVAVNGNNAYTTNYQTTAPWTVRYLKSWDITNPNAPVLLQTVTLNNATAKPGEVVIEGDLAFVGDLNNSQVEIYNIANPSNMIYLSTLQATANFNVAEDASSNISVNGNYVYVTSGGNATYGGAIDFFDITNPSAPVKITTYFQNEPTSPFGAAVVYNNILYVANYGTPGGFNSTLNTYSTQTFLSNNIDARNLFAVSAQLVSIASGATGTYEIQASDDYVDLGQTPQNWSTIASGSISGSGDILIPKTDLSYQNIRLEYTNTGTGGFVANMKALGH